MDHVVNENDVHFANYDFDKPIKISYIFENDDSDETPTFENSQPPQTPGPYSTPRNNSHNNSANNRLNRTLLDHNFHSNVSFDDMEHGLNIDNNTSTNSKGVENHQPSNSYAMSQPQSPLGEMRNVDKRMSDYNFLLNNENTQYSYLLDTVSENLIMILKYFRFFSMNYAKDHKARENYLNHKVHYYNQSYNAIVAVFLPQEHNHVFMRNFIKRTIDIANRKQLHHNVTFIRSLEFLLKDLIQWTKQRKYMETRNNQLKRPPPPYNIASGTTRQMNTQAVVSLGPLTSTTYDVSSTYTRPMGGPVSFISSDSTVQPPLYSTSNISRQQPMSRPTNSIPTTIPHLPPASYSFSNVNPGQPYDEYGRPVSLAPSDLPLPRSSSQNKSNIDTRLPTNLPPPVSLRSCLLPEPTTLHSISNVNTLDTMTRTSVSVIREALPLASNSPSNVNPEQPHGRPVSIAPTNLPLPRSSSQNKSNIDTRLPTNLPPPVSLRSCLLPEPTTLCSISNVNTLDTTTRISVSVIRETPPLVSNSPSNVNPEQPHFRPVSLAPTNLPLPRSSSHNNSNMNTQQTTRRPSPNSFAKSDPSLTPTLNSFSSVNSRQLQSTLPPVTIIPSNLPVPRSSSQNKSNIDTRLPTNITPPVSCVPSVLPEPATIYSTSNIDTLQTTPSTSVSVVQESLPPASNNITNSNTNQGIPADEDNTICLFSTGPPGSEISISIDAAIAKVVNDVNLSKKDNAALHNRASKRRKTDNVKSPNMLCTRIWTPPMQKQLQQNNHNNCESSNQTPLAPNSDSANTIIEPCYNIHFNQLNAGRGQNDKEYDSNKCQPILSRSESRDSGFGSPVLSTLSTTNDNNTVYPHCMDNRDFAPVITHVTSMNTDAVFIASGTCKICSATTKNKCIACYKEYYCGSQCQTIDWPYHMKVCTPR